MFVTPCRASSDMAVQSVALLPTPPDPSTKSLLNDWPTILSYKTFCSALSVNGMQSRLRVPAVHDSRRVKAVVWYNSTTSITEMEKRSLSVAEKEWYPNMLVLGVLEGHILGEEAAV